MDFRTLLKTKEFVILDGAMGTMLQAKGLEMGGTPEALNMVLRIPGGFAFGMNPLRTLISLPTLIVCASGQKSRWSEKFNTCPSGELANP